MPTKTWAVGEEVLAADFNAMVQRQVVATFPNAAARTAALATPTAGMLTYLADVNRYEYWNGAAWSAWSGILSKVITINAQTGITTTPLPLTGLQTAALTIPANRQIEVSAGITFTKAGADTANWAALAIDDNGAQIQAGFGSMPAPGWLMAYVSVTLTPTAGAHTFRALGSTGAGFLNTQVASNAPGWLRVVDLGAA